jgi:hypothetical protein
MPTTTVDLPALQLTELPAVERLYWLLGDLEEALRKAHELAVLVVGLGTTAGIPAAARYIEDDEFEPDHYLVQLGFGEQLADLAKGLYEAANASTELGEAHGLCLPAFDALDDLRSQMVQRLHNVAPRERLDELEEASDGD